MRNDIRDNNLSLSRDARIDSKIPPSSAEIPPVQRILDYKWQCVESQSLRRYNVYHVDGCSSNVSRVRKFDRTTTRDRIA